MIEAKEVGGVRQLVDEPDCLVDQSSLAQASRESTSSDWPQLMHSSSSSSNHNNNNNSNQSTFGDLSLANVSHDQSSIMNLTCDTDQACSPDNLLLAAKQKKRRKKKKRPPHKSKMITGYIIYASEIRKDIIKKYPDQDFGYISKIVGLEWKNLPQETKAAYEKRAQEQNAKSKAIAAQAVELQRLADAAAAELTATRHPGSSSANLTCNGSSHHDANNNTNGLANSYISAANNQHLVHNYSSPVDADLLMQSNMLRQPQQQQQQQQYLVQGRQQTSVMVRTTDSQQPFSQQIVQQQQIHQTVTTVHQYSSGDNINSNGTNTYSPSNAQPKQSSLHLDSTNSNFLSQEDYRKNNIVYRKPTSVRLKPKDASTQTEPTVWKLADQPKKPLKLSQKFLDHLNNVRQVNKVINK